ncbi:hypothetical protein GGX14DRAFT_463064 [Mycena pura]|uniref:F-box domain-containing protein n=1 Tax=Mycena pura TaxID=153505 RepID=A0AAD6V514_9AGAR|nr:hypothetical protein GGX14DRAFT_463064 [Mycena pura]
MPARRSRSQPDVSETSYTEYLHTNFIPSQDECRRIRDLVVLKTQEVEKATDELKRLQASVDRIFMACLPENGYASMKSSEPPLLLCRLCRLESWLNRSGGLPLSIFFAMGTKSVLQSLVDRAPRWENIRFKDLSHDSLEVLAQLSPEDVPLLKTVVIENRNGGEPILSFLSAVHIRCLSLWSCFGIQNLTSPLGVSHLCLRGLPSAHTLHLLRHCPLLETCTLVAYTAGDALPLHVGPRIRLERMRYLCILDRDGSRDVLEHIFLPNLRSLEYSNDGRGWSGLDTFLASLCAPEMITDLNLSTKISAELLANVLRPFSMLQKLILHLRRMSLKDGVPECSLFTLLTPSSLGSAEVLCPRLQSICSLGFDAGSDEELFTMIDARRTMVGIQPLANVHVAFTRELQVNILPRLPCNLTFSLFYPTEDDAKLIGPGPNYRAVARKSVAMRRAPVPPDTLQLRLWRHDVNVDWDPISREWLAEYDEWGLEEEELEEDADDENSDEDS